MDKREPEQQGEITMKNIVSIVRCLNYEYSVVAQALFECLKQLGLGAQDFTGQTILIKPNLFQGFSPERCGTTHPMVVKALVDFLHSRGAKLIIGDNPACLKSGSNNQYLKILEETGMTSLGQTSKYELIYPNEQVEVNRWTLSKIIFEVDLIVNVPKLKGHGFMGITGSVKNLFGLIPGMIKLDYHALYREPDDFANMLVELCLFLKPQLTIMDGIHVLDGEGSVNRDFKRFEILAGSRNPFAIDQVIARIFNIRPDLIPTNRIAIRSGICEPKNIVIVGEKNSKLKSKFDFFGSRIQRMNHAYPKKEECHHCYPVVNQDKCTNCGRCLMICPFTALRIVQESLTLDKQKCHECYCCIEACNSAAIDLATK